MVGHHVPVVPMERQYLVTENVPGIRDLKQELPILRDISAPLYMRQEQQSLLLGLFDKEPVFWAADGTPPGFEQELLVPDLERVSHAFERALQRVPILGELGVKRVVNGPLMRTPDGNPLVGPVPGLDGYWMNGGYFAGFGLSGALTSRLAEWIIEGEPQIDLSGFDVRRMLPALLHAPGDSGRFITAGVVVVRDPETGIYNASYHRLQMHGPDRLGIKLDYGRHLQIGRAHV